MAGIDTNVKKSTTGATAKDDAIRKEHADVAALLYWQWSEGECSDLMSTVIIYGIDTK